MKLAWDIAIFCLFDIGLSFFFLKKNKLLQNYVTLNYIPILRKIKVKCKNERERETSLTLDIQSKKTEFQNSGKE